VIRRMGRVRDRNARGVNLKVREKDKERRENSEKSGRKVMRCEDVE